MIHARTDYDQIQDASGKIPVDEPVFLLRGQDPFAPKLLRMWAKMLKEKIGKNHTSKLVRKWAKVMEGYQKDMEKQGKTIHIPDTPENVINPITLRKN